MGTVTDTAEVVVTLAGRKAKAMLVRSNQAKASQHAVAVIRDKMDASVATVVIRASEEPRVVWDITRTISRGP